MNRCVILAVDPGATSGWATLGFVQQSGTAETQAKRLSVVIAARCAAADYRLPLVIVAESHTRFGKWSASAAAGTAAQWGRWQVAIDDARLDAMPKLGRHKAFCGVVRVTSNDWYRLVVGSTRDTRETRLRRAMLRAGVSDPDEACAVCIGLWAQHAREVQKRLPAAFKEAKR